MMNIQISNDDGNQSEGIVVLARALASIAHNHVVAPDRDRSGASSSLPVDSALGVYRIGADG